MKYRATIAFSNKAATVLGGLLICSFCGWSAQQGAETTAPEDSTAQAPVEVQVARVETIKLQPMLDLVGTIVALPEATAVISPQLGGWVNQLKVVEGQSVAAGEVLIEFDARSAQIAVERAKAVVAEKQAVVDRLKSGYLPEEIAAAQQDASNAAATLEGLKNELTALKKLLDRNEISSVMYETKSKAVESATATLASAQERAKLLEAGTRPEMIAEAQGLLDAAKADAEQAALALQWCSITSPIDGVVVQLLARQGQFFDKAAPMITITDLSNVFVQLRIPSRDFAQVKVGAPVEVQLGSLPGQTFAGTIDRISGQADPLTGNIFVFARVVNNNQLLRPGLSCQARISLPSIANALVVPVAAVADNSGTSVVTIIRDGKAYETAIEVGVETQAYAQVLKGLIDGEVVATAGGVGLPAGCPVKVVTDLARSSEAPKPEK